MTAPEGAFYSAEDADSPLPEDPSKKGEGAFYLWNWDEVDDVVRTRFGFERDGNAHNDPHGEFTGKNILYVASPRPVSPDTMASLLAVRSQRPRPYRDDKILTAWNGLMVSAFAKGAQVLDDPEYAAVAQRAADFFT
ncbi:MAG: thioredoxin domain-containing protein, partial [Bryobacteraceae bacterium]